MAGASKSAEDAAAPKVANKAEEVPLAIILASRWCERTSNHLDGHELCSFARGQVQAEKAAESLA